VIDVLEKLAVDPLVDWNGGSVCVDEQDGNLGIIRGESSAREKRARPCRERHGSGGRHRTHEKVSSIHAIGSDSHP